MTTDMFCLSFMTYHWVCDKSNTTGATSGAGTGSFGAPELKYSGMQGLVRLTQVW